jgi:manganese transport protein
VLVTSIDILLILALFDRYSKYIEFTVGFLIFLVLSCFCIELFLSQPILTNIIHGFVPSWQIVADPEMRLLAIGILGATVMPHNLYLHSSLVIEKSKKHPKNLAIKMLSIDSTFSLLIAFFINSSILILAAASFYTKGYSNIVDIEQAHQMLNPLLGVTFAGAVFAIALLASGQNASITGTMAGQIVMEGFMDWKMKPWLRRLITRSLAILPSWAILYFFGEGQTMNLLIFSQVILSFQLGFAVIPLIHFTSSAKIMGEYKNSTLMMVLLSIVAIVVIGFNVFSLAKLVF